MMDGSQPMTVDLLRRWHGGDREALETLLERNLDWIRSYVHKRLHRELRREKETQDFVQEAVVDALCYGPRFEITNETHFRALLARIVENNLRDRHKWLHRKRRDIALEKPGVSDSVLQLDPPARAVTTPSLRAHKQESADWVRLALELLEPEDREIILMREWENLSFEEIGERLSRNADAARMRYHRALPKLAKKVAYLQAGRVANCLDEPQP